MTLTKKEQAARLKPHQAHKSWFYLSTGRGVNSCSFHHEQYGYVYIPASTLMRALQRTGLLRQWDRKQQVFRKVQA